MPDVDKILEQLLGNRRLKEGAAFSSRTYSDQPIIQTGRQMRERAERGARPGQAHGAQAGSAAGTAAPTDAGRVNAGPGAVRTNAGVDVARPDRPARSARPATGGPVPQYLSQRPSQQATQWQLTFDLGQRQDAGEPPRTQRTPAQPAQSQQPVTPVPQRYYQLRELAADQPQLGSASWRGALAYGTRSANRLFYEQARLMEDFEDEFEFHGTYFQYFPTYSSMTLTQLRGYFSWRTQVRHGQMPEAPLSFAFLHVYELLCGIGTTPGQQGLADLLAFKEAFGPTAAAQGSTFASYMRRWLQDYVVYHGLDPALLPSAGAGVQTQIFTLLRAEEAALAAQGLARKEAPLSATEAPSEQEVMAALNECSSYQICGARLYKEKPDDVRTVACEVFRRLVAHCSRRRKTDFVEGLFGGATVEPYTMFSSAVFHEPHPHPDVVFHLNPVETFTCRGGKWRRHLLCGTTSRSPELGAIMHAVDQRLRDRLDYPYPLKARPVAAYVTKIIDGAVDALLEAKAEAERRRITIDLSQLGRIRAVAAVTQEALLTDEERDVATGTAAPMAAATADTPPAVAVTADDALSVDKVADGATPAAAVADDASTLVEKHDDAAAAEPVTAPADGARQDVPHTNSLGLSLAELEVLQALLQGASVPQNPGGQMLSLVIDSINEKFFEEVGDTVIEFDGDAPMLVEDYEQDVRDVVQA